MTALLLLGVPAARLIQRDERPLFTNEEKKRIIWFPQRTLLPAVSARREALPIRTANGNSQQAISTESSNPSKQVVWVPASHVHLPSDIRSPNLIAVNPAPPQVRQDIKQFRMPGPGKIPDQSVLPELPRLDLALPKATEPPNLIVANQPQRRVYVPPPMPSGARRPAALDDDVPAIAPSAAPSNVSAAIVGLTPANVPVALPEGSRSGALHTGVPDGNDRVTSGGAAGSVIVPGLTVRGAAGSPVAGSPGSAPAAPPINAPPPSIPKTGTPERPFRNQSVSVAYWPNARHLSPLLESRFRTRVVYATVLPAPRLTPRVPDWTLWFAEVEPGVAGAQPLIRPPVAFSSVAPEVPMLAAQRENATIRVAAVLHNTGRLDSMVPIQGTDANLVQGIVDALSRWQFHPAFRDGVAVDVEVVVEIPVPLRPPAAPVADVR